jgi:exonuclease SbcD
MIKFGHIADCHINRKFIIEGIKALSQIKDNCLKEKVEFLIIAGDFWDKLVHLTEDSPVNKATTIIKEIAEIIPIIIIYGNHDVRGSLEIFEKLSSNITVISEPELLCKVEGKIQKYNDSLNPDALFFCFPYLRKEGIKKKLKEEKREKIIEKSEHIIESYVRYTKQKMLEKVKHLDLNKIYKIAIAHGSMRGVKTAKGQDSHYLNKDVHFIEDTFEEMDYIALGHIHAFQTLGKEYRACYPSSIYSVNFSEEGDRFCLIVEIDEDKTLKVLPKKLDVQLVKTLKINLDELPPQRKIIINRLNELNTIASAEKNTRWKIEFYGLRNTLEYLKDFTFSDNIILDKNFSDTLSIKDVEDGDGPLTFEEKVIKYIEINKGVKWTKSLEVKFNKINEDKIQYYNSEEDDE